MFHMARLKYHAAIFAAAAVLAGCTFVADTIFPVFTGEEPSEPRETVQIPPSPGEERQQPVGAPAAPSPRLGPTVAQAEPGQTPPTPPTPRAPAFEPTRVAPGQPTGTMVGKKVVELGQELERLRGTIAEHNGVVQRIRDETEQNSRRYHATVAAINTRLQVGTTPGNPVLVQQWNRAQTELNHIADNINQMNTVAGKVSSDSAMAAYLLETTRATYGISGAVDEDHRQLAIVEDELNRTVVLIDRLLNEVTADADRQSNYLARERKNLTTLSLAVKSGELLGASLANRALAPAAGTPSARVEPGESSRRPLVVIRFDRSDVNYEQALYTAVSRALERRPNAVFDLVAVTPKPGTPSQAALGATSARRNAEKVRRSLTNMGLPQNRVNLSAMTSADAKTSEVHIYVR